MTLGACPCCGSRNLKKLQGEQFTCVDCKAPLRFTWSAAHIIGIFLPVFLPNLLKSFPDTVQYGVPAVLLVVLLILYYRYRRFYVDDIGVAEAINARNSDLTHINRFVAGKIGAIDFVSNIDALKSTYAKEPAIQTLIQDHFNRVGGLSLSDQAAGFSAVYPSVDLMSIAAEQQKAANDEIARLKTYKITV
ncbi:hypothetical protein [Cellvibrio sp. UBA7661]|uniref:hypothetical protein n=1 Tax=Cellvibrio sp. UBA7661 TaxID=1946311 RepID=UPI002F35B422